jgi:hypothetical protein
MVSDPVRRNRRRLMSAVKLPDPGELSVSSGSGAATGREDRRRIGRDGISVPSLLRA